LKSAEGDLYVNGRENIFSFPDLGDFGELSGLLKVIEQRICYRRFWKRP